VLAILASALPRAAAQSCAMCYQNAAASGAQGRTALQHGILVLFVPAISFFGGILLLLYTRRHVAEPDRMTPHRRNNVLPEDCTLH
jgi:hypothetical protein